MRNYPARQGDGLLLHRLTGSSPTLGYFGGVFQCTHGLQERFGDRRCFDSPISETGIFGGRTYSQSPDRNDASFISKHRRSGSPDAPPEPSSATS